MEGLDELEKQAETPTKTRRILELQSDLFQKGRDKESLTGNFSEFSKNPRIFTIDGRIYNGSGKIPFKSILNERGLTVGKQDITEEEFIEAKKKHDEIAFMVKKREAMIWGKSNQFLQLLNKSNNWVTFFVKSIIQDSAKKGYEKVVFPKLDTIIQIESVGRFKTYSEAEKALKDDRWEEIDKEYRQVLQEQQEEYDKNPTEKLKKLIVESKERISSHQPSLLNTAKFYENDITNILKKQGYNPKQVTDEYGNTWNEISTIEQRDLSAIAFRLAPTTTKSTGSANEQRAKKWLEERFPGMAVEFYDTAKQIGDDFVHGYVENASMFLWTQGEVGTEYHEAYHIAFRTMLSEAQRDQLYAEALSTYGEPDTAVVSKLAKQFNISTEEARKLALEEKMAEDFREYVLTEQASANTLPGRIKSWFKNLWNWIKAMLSDGVSIRQVYSLVESNNMHKSLLSRKVFRNSEKFKGYNTAFMQMPGMGDTLAAHTLDTIKLKFIEAKESYGKNFDVNRVVGSGTNKGSIANSFLQELYVDRETLQNLSVAASIEILNAENKFFEVKSDPKSTPEEQAAAKKGLAEALAKHNAALALKGETTKREAFKHVYNNWNTVVEERTGNIVTPGWRDMLAITLEDSGLTLRGKDSNYNNYELIEDEIPDEEKEAVENELEAMETHVAKIYGKSSLEDSPAKRLTGKVKELLSRIPRTEPIFVVSV